MLERILKACNKKGFTLVELIVVLVIMALLAAVLVPSLIGWIGKAQEQTHAAEARAAYTSAVALQTEKWASQKADLAFTEATKGDAKAIIDLAGVPGTVTAISITGGHEVSAITYVTKDEKYQYAMTADLTNGGAGGTTVTKLK